MKNFGNKNYQVSIDEKSLLITMSFFINSDFDSISVSAKDIVEFKSIYDDLKIFFDENDRFFWFYDNYEFLHSNVDLKIEKIEKVKSLSTEEMIDYIISGKTYLNTINDNIYINAEDCGFGKIMNTPKIRYNNNIVERNSYLLNCLPFSKLNNVTLSSKDIIKLFNYHKDVIKDYFVDELGINMFYKLTIIKITLTSNLSFYRVRYEGAKIEEKNEKRKIS